TSGLGEFIEYYREKGSTVTALYDVGDPEKAKQLSIAQIAADGRILRFEEKPEKPSSTLAGTGIYAFPPRSLKRIHEYLREGNNPDNPGYFIQWLCGREPVYGYVLKGKWWDIGTPETYLEAKAYFGERQ
ncbi:MAG: sugar phosphate nucleotidyltransferase, partial [Candidatus Korarchaeum sp.]|nr:sugar phosphate nucleotidyltransferase [Candidatus Korarchaeum sp.]